MFGLCAFATPSRARAPIGLDDTTSVHIAHFGRMWRRKFAGVTLDNAARGKLLRDRGRPAVQRAIVRFNALIAQDWPKPGDQHRHWTHGGSRRTCQTSPVVRFARATHTASSLPI
jgi:hypothetical protein